MAKEQSSKQKPAPSKAKKGLVIDRRRNRTNPHQVYNTATSNGKWEHVGGGVLIRFGSAAHGPHSNPIRLEGGKFRSVSYQKETPAEQDKVWAKVGVEIPLPPPSAAGLTVSE